jgi:nitrite reductase (NO-forming)
VGSNPTSSATSTSALEDDWSDASGQAMPVTAGRSRRHAVGIAVVLAWLLAAGGVLLAGGRIADGGWLALHMALLGAVTNAIFEWSEHFAATLLHARPTADRLVWARTVLLNLGAVLVLTGVHGARPGLVGGGAGVLGLVVVGQASILGSWLRRGLGGPRHLGDTVWFYLAGSGALLSGIGLGVMLSAGPGSADTYRAIRLAHAHLNVLGWIGLAVIGTLFTLWPSVLRTRIVPGIAVAARWALLLCVGGLAATTVGLLTQGRVLTLVGLCGYIVGLGGALVPFLTTAHQRTPRSAAAWMLAAGVSWLVVSVAVDLARLLGADRVVDLDAHLGRLIPAVAVGFGLQVVMGALSFLLPVVLGHGPQGNRRLTRLLELGWPVRVALLNLGVALRTFGPDTGWTVRTGWWLVGLAAGSFVLLAIAALVRATVLDNSARGGQERLVRRP